MPFLPAQNEEFKTLMDRAKWSAAEVARRLQVSKSIISGYLNGDKPPPASKISLLRFLVMEQMGQTESSQSKLAEETPTPLVHQALNELHDIKDRIYSLERTLDRLKNELPPIEIKKYPPSSLSSDAAKASAVVGAHAERHALPGLPLSRATGVPTAQTAKPGSGIEKHSNRQLSAEDQTQAEQKDE